MQKDRKNDNDSPYIKYDDYKLNEKVTKHDTPKVRSCSFELRESELN